MNERGGMDFADYVYDATSHRWRFAQVEPDRRQEEREEAVRDAQDQRRRDRIADADDTTEL